MATLRFSSQECAVRFWTLLAKFHHLATSWSLKSISKSRCSVIPGLFETHEGFSDLAREERLTHTLNKRVTTETMLGPFRSMDQLRASGVIWTRPNFAVPGSDVISRVSWLELEGPGRLGPSGVRYLYRFCNPEYQQLVG